MYGPAAYETSCPSGVNSTAVCNEGERTCDRSVLRLLRLSIVEALKKRNRVRRGHIQRRVTRRRQGPWPSCDRLLRLNFNSIGFTSTVLLAASMHVRPLNTIRSSISANTRGTLWHDAAILETLELFLFLLSSSKLKALCCREVLRPAM